MKIFPSLTRVTASGRLMTRILLNTNPGVPSSAGFDIFIREDLSYETAPVEKFVVDGNLVKRD